MKSRKKTKERNEKEKKIMRSLDEKQNSKHSWKMTIKIWLDFFVWESMKYKKSKNKNKKKSLVTLET